MASVTFDSIGAGGVNFSSTPAPTVSTSWTHNVSSSDRNTCVTALITYWPSGLNESVTVTYGGVSMSLIQTMTDTSGGQPVLQASFKLFNPLTGPQTVTVKGTSNTGSFLPAISGNSLAYHGVGLAVSGGTNSGTANSLSITVPSQAGQVVLATSETWNGTTSPNQTVRWQDNTGQTNQVIQEAAGANSVTFSGTTTGGFEWDYLAAILLPPVQPPDYTDIQALLPALNADPRIASTAAWTAAQPYLVPSNEITITVYNKIYQPTGEINDHISLEAEWKRNDIGTATIVLKGNDPNIANIMKATTEVVPIVIQAGANMRWSGRVNSYALALDAKKETLTVECVDDFTWFSRILVWPDFLLPIEIQFPKNSIYVGPVISCVLTMVSEQVFRLQTGLWQFINDPLDSILGFDAEWKYFTEKWQAAGGNPAEMLMIPIVVQFIDPIFDTSPWVAVQGRMDKIYDLVKDLLMNYGLSLTATLWLPGDPQPPTESMGFSFIPFGVPLTQPTIVVSCVNRSGVVGPTNTFVDGLIEDVVDLQASVLGTTLSPFLNPQNEYYPANLGVNIAPELGVNFIPSWVIFNGDDINAGGAITYKLSGYAPISHTIIGGGKSPKWLNDLIDATLEFLIDAIEITVGFTGIPDDLLNGTFDDIILAFQEMENVQRRAEMGPYGFPEYFTKTGASAFTLDEWFALMQAMFDTSGYNCIQLKWANGYPYTVGQDVFLGSLVSFVRQGQMYTDYVYSIMLKDDRKTRAEVDIIVGNGKREINPILRVVKMITGVEEVLNTISMSS